MEIGQIARVEQARYVHRNYPTAMFGGLVISVLVAVVFWGVVEPLYLIDWLSLVVVLNFWRLYGWRRYRGADFSVEDAGRWLRIASCGALLSGSLWGAAWFFLYPQPELGYQVLFIYAVTMMTNAALFSYGVHYPTYLSFLLASLLPAAVFVIAWNSPQQAAMNIGVLILIVVGLRSARSFNRLFNESLHLRFQNAGLVEELTRQKEAAESANLAKSRFLAAASHDLRQPMHALNLYLGALAGIPLPDHAQPLLGKVRQCAQTMDDMFRALLDISRLDAGAVQPGVGEFALQPLLERIRVEFEPQAREKAIELRVVRSHIAVRSDPELLERIVRNLVSNAVRYTERGKVLVGCRARGDRIELSVYDTGIGIARDKQQLVFEEFYQVGNLERDRNKGLGLGLAIVERLARLLEVPIELRSQPGYGSVFTLRLLRATSLILPARKPLDAQAGQRSFAELLVVVVDDEELIRDAVRVLLEQWGCEVVTADGGDMARARLCESRRAPDLLICDYRLRGSETGVDVIESLRNEFNTDIPAILLTGDTAPERIRKIGSTGLPVLHKPLREEQLGEAIAQYATA